VRLLLFTGKGGVGKTTLAAATAVRVADSGSHVLVVSTDPAHSLADAFDMPLGAEPRQVAHDLDAVQIDQRALVDSAWHELRASLAEVLTGSGVDTLDAAELSVLPGVDEVLALTEVQRFAADDRWDIVIVDCGPTAETLRLLALPEAVSGYLSNTRVTGRRSRVRRTVRELSRSVESLRALLTDPERTTVRLVLTPERVVAAEARRTVGALALRDIGVDEMIMNRMVPAPGWWRGRAAAWLRDQWRQQQAVLAEIGGFEHVRTVSHHGTEPVGFTALREIGTQLYGTAPPLEATPGLRSPLMRVSETTGGYELRVAVPLEQEAAIGLARVDDELAVTVHGFRRLIALPPQLRPCRVTDAEADAEGLLVHLAAEGMGG